jgi:hypothetical protein
VNALLAAGLCCGVHKGWLRLRLASQCIIIGELIVFGLAPSLATPAAIISLPAIVLAVVYLIRGRVGPQGEIYLTLCTLLASGFLLWEGIVLARLLYERHQEGTGRPSPAACGGTSYRTSSAPTRLSPSYIQ